jgi:hypothetical protein
MTYRGWLSFLRDNRRRKAHFKKKHVEKHGGSKIDNSTIFQAKSVVKSHLDKLQKNTKITSLPRSRKGSVRLNTPKVFCLLSNPEESIQFVAKVSRIINNLNYNEIDFNHLRTKEFSLGAEALLGNVVKELTELRDYNGFPFGITGSLPFNTDHADLIREIGIVKELDANLQGKSTENKQNIHLFSKECVLDGSDSSSSDDYKTNATLEFVEHINSGLKVHKLKLKDEYSKHLKSSLAEVLDNAEEHSSLSAPKWFVKGYLNNNCEKKMLELVIFNYGSTVYDNFMKLEADNYTRKRVDGYVARHSDIVDEEVLYNIMALQVRVSTKNFKLKDTRGHGSIKLLKLFQSLHSGFRKLRGSDEVDNNVNKPEMSIISGNSFLKFDGKYSLFNSIKTGESKPLLTFNHSTAEMYSPPDSDYVKKMEVTFFPGVFISIRVPLIGSIENKE